MKGIDLKAIRRNRLVFEQWNRLRREYAYELNAERASVVFEIIPALLSVNEPFLPGFVAGADADCGIFGSNDSKRLERVIYDYFPETRARRLSFQRFVIHRGMIESLFLMGSIGSVAQTSKSDFDFWVCVDGDRFSEKSLARLQGKAEAVALWCRKKFAMEAHFFVLDLEKIRANDFGKVDEESTGSSQRKFLKEECYRTMLLVSGKIPLWWVLPAGIGEDAYQHHVQGLAGGDSEEVGDFVDLGYIGGVSKREFLGTALWNLSKAIKDPFKALLKMALMEWYLSESYRGTLLCDALKEDVLGGRTDPGKIDPYLLMVKTILDFYSQEERSGHVDLVRKAFYIKADPNITRLRLKTDKGNHRIETFKKLLDQWEWSLDMAEDLNQMESWSYARHLRFSEELNKFFFGTYRRLSEGLRHHEKQAINDADLTILGRKIFALFAKHENKLQVTPFLVNKRLALDRCAFQFEPEREGKGRWSVCDMARYPYEAQARRPRIHATDRVARAAAWLVLNGLYDSHRSMIEMQSNPSGVTAADLIDLLRHLEAFFRPTIEQMVEVERFREPAGIEQMMLIVDMEEPVRPKEPATIDLVFTNTWGEMFTETYSFKKGLVVTKDYVSSLFMENSEQVGSKVRVHIRKSLSELDEKNRVYRAIFQHSRT